MKLTKEILDKKEHGDFKKISDKYKGTIDYVSLPTLIKAFKEKRASRRVYGVIVKYYESLNQSK